MYTSFTSACVCVCVCVCTRVALLWISVHDDVRKPIHDLLDQTICQCGHSLMIILNTHTQTHTNIKSQDVWLHLLSFCMFGCICFYLHLLLGDAAGGSQPDSQRGGDSARTQPPLLPASVLQWLHTHSGTASHIQSAHTCTHIQVL